MRESVIDVLFYLFDDILPEQQAQETDLNEMAYWLSEAGFQHEDVGRALEWFYELTQLGEAPPPVNSSAAVRVFSAQERDYLGDNGLDYLRGLKRLGLIDHHLFEKIIERALALEEPLDTLTLRWVAAMVALNIYGHSQAELAEPLRDEFLSPLEARIIH